MTRRVKCVISAHSARSVAATVSETKRATPLQPLHCLKYGLSTTGRDLKNDVTCVQCEFCFIDGRSGYDSGRKRARTSNVQLYTPPYRPELYRKHLEGQHADQWRQYNSMSNASKKEYFASKKATSPTISSLFDSKGSDDVLKSICQYNLRGV